MKTPLNDTARRILDGIADDAERETAIQVCQEAAQILTQRAYHLNGSHELSADAERRLMNAVGAQHTR